ncbi:heavy metal translocating P-type ATPase [Faecalibacterium wellingii]|uniref:Cd(2+)-exporting ATPase n=1 Tax=Faecalibacterium wellingii TaxID=2929491 RepID=A0ABU3U0X3_9FIRM|nr:MULTISPECIES: heavy metal translocating P-type ATPase [Faecalibacterium]MDU8689202.1 heavy metal translocating P-type ATPase [Faecalibacterium prausnitzii]UQK56211.1 heavy metal translocating P-type ATPase [Faecalibacterium sp. HTF-F]
MKCTILHEGKGRMRVHVEKVRMTLHRADVLEAYLNHHDAIVHAAVYERTGDVVITYTGRRSAAIAVLAGYKFDVAEYDALVTSADSRRLNREYQDKMFDLVAGRCLRKLFLPAPLDAAYTAFRSIHFLWKGVRCVLSRRLEVEVLDALSIGVSLLRGDFGTAGSVMFLLNLGSLLEEWTRKKSLDDLARSMALNVDKVWVRSQGTEVLVPLTKVRSGDEVVVRSGNMIPLDGTVLEGEAMVNQAALTGEAMPVRKAEGSTLYAGTVVEEGECVFIAKAEGGSNRYDKIVAMIEESEKLKSSTENRALVLADKLVPWCLGATVVTYLLTRNATRAISCLMVDFSCALKLSMPLAVLSAMRECGSYHITVKGGKYLEALSKADTIVFDKTGTLTRATPQVVEVVPFSGCNEREVLQLAACLEEHFPHSMANAVVRAAKEHGISHEEMHSEVEYIVAHGIASRVGGERVVIGSHHFVFEDEKCTIPAAEQQKFDALKPAYSHLYMAASGQLVGVICISDPLRPEAAAVLNGLRALGIQNTVMMTGDSERTAAAIAKQVGVDRFFAEVLPEDKANFVQQAKAEGHTVVMIGDGINDSPALSAADIGIAINSGAAIAREIADVTIKADSLEELVALKAIANSLQKRVHANYRFVLTFNSALIALGALGILQPASSAMLHNLSTIGISLKSMTNLLPENRAPQLKA